MCIPKITHHRSRLFGGLVHFEDNGADYFSISKDIYPELFELQHPQIVRKARNQKFQQKDGKNLKYLWFPPKALSDSEKEEITSWVERYQKYVLLNEGRLGKHFSSELDFCMALDFNYTVNKDEKRVHTPVGELVYKIKYQHKNGSDLINLVKMVEAGISDLPTQAFTPESIIVTCVPGESEEKLPYKIVTALGASKKWECRPCTIKKGTKPKSKELPLKDKIEQYEKFYASMAAMGNALKGKNIIIVDDLYQSGATLWSYAKYLKAQGANATIGLACEKSWHDDDNKQK